MTMLLILAIKLVAQLILILWWACQLTGYYTVRGVRRVRANHQRWQMLNENGDVIHVKGPAQSAGDLRTGGTRAVDAHWEPTADSAVDLARRTQAAGGTHA